MGYEHSSLRTRRRRRVRRKCGSHVRARVENRGYLSGSTRVVHRLGSVFRDGRQRSGNGGRVRLANLEHAPDRAQRSIECLRRVLGSQSARTPSLGSRIQ